MGSLLEVHCSIGRSVKSNKVQRGALGSGNRFDTHATHDGAAEDKDGYYFCAGLMKGTVRGAKHVTRCTLIVIDIDEMDKRQIDKMLFMLDESDLEHIIYTTTRHTPDEPRYRLIFNPSREMSTDEYKCVVKELCEELAIVIPDKASLVPASPMFYPLALTEHADEAYIGHIEGEQVDVDHHCKARVGYRSDGEVADDADYMPNTVSDPMAIPGALDESVWLSQVLSAYPAKGLDYHGWVEVGMVLHHQTYGRAFEVWYAWSAKNTEAHGRKYGRADMEYKWNSFVNDKRYKLVSLRKLLNYKNSSGRTILSVAYKGLINILTEPGELKRVQIDIQDEEFLFGNDYRGIATAYKSAAKRLNDDDMSVGEAMQLLRSDHSVSGTHHYFHDNYVFSREESAYYHIITKDSMPVPSMNYEYGDRMPASNSGERKIVHKVLTNGSNGFVKPRVIRGLAYEVEGDSIISEGGHLYLNQFVPDSWPDVERAFDYDVPLDKQIREAIFQHLKLLCNGDTVLIRMILQHLGHLRQRPMQRMHFSYAISSLLQGVGKSTIRKLYETVLGAEQVGLVTPDAVAEKFNAWATAPKLMTFIEEFEFDTRREQNRAIKKMKDLITSDSVSVRKMHTDTRLGRSYTAYAIFSNDEYVLGHESVGRRWVPIIVDSVNKDQAAEVLGEDHIEFYRRYHRLMDDHAERFVAFFDQISLEGFDPERPPEGAQGHAFTSNVPVMRTCRILQEIIEEQSSLDLTAQYACGNSAHKLFRNHIDFVDSVDSDEMKHFSSSQQRNIINKALRLMAYRQVSQSDTRIRINFEEQTRVRLNDIWVKDHKKFGGTKGSERLQHFVKRERIRRESEAEARRKTNVVTMDGNAYEEK